MAVQFVGLAIALAHKKEDAKLIGIAQDLLMPINRELLTVVRQTLNTLN
jgi:hypothetical protein